MADYSAYNEDRTAKTCKSCNTELPISSFRVRRRKRERKSESWLNSVCTKCEQAGVTQYRTSTAKGRAAEIVRRCKYVAKKEGVGFDLTVDWVLSTLDRQGWNCALSGLPMKKTKIEGERLTGFNWDSISTDRIVPSGPYTQVNVRFILNCLNVFRGNGTDEIMYRVAAALLLNRQKG